jgi:hypothetical protein
MKDRAVVAALPIAPMELETGWLCAQSRANPSLRGIPCLTGKEQGIFAIQAHFVGENANYPAENTASFLQIPYSTEQGIFSD